MNLKQDRFLLGILIGLGVLIVLALGLFFLRRTNQEYRPDGTATGVVHNYVLALQNEDWERAYGYLGEVENKPGVEAFRLNFLTLSEALDQVSVQVGDVDTADNEAYVEVSMVRSNGPLGDVSRTDERAILRLDPNGAWKIYEFPYPYWSWEWSNPVPKLSPPS